MKRHNSQDIGRGARGMRKLFSAARLHGWGLATAASLLQIRLFARIWRNLLGRPVSLFNILNFRMYLDLSDPGLSWQLITRGTREIEHVNDIVSSLRPGMTGIDLGANMGFFALIESGILGPSGKLYCIEPVSANMELLRKNITENGYNDRVEIYQNIVSDSNGQAKIRLSPASNSHRVLSPDEQHSDSRQVSQVEAISIDTFMEERGIKPEEIDFLRCDIEGHEAVALRGMRKILSSKSPMHLFIEFHPDVYHKWGTDIRGLLQLLYSSGFRLRRVVKEFPNSSGTEPFTEILTAPSADEYLEQQATWAKGGVQAHLERK